LLIVGRGVVTWCHHTTTPAQPRGLAAAEAHDPPTPSDRDGRVSVARLIEEYGEGMGLPDLRDILAADCPRVALVAYHERCAVHYPQLPTLCPSSERR
jgi:hypothetical protein